MLSEKRKKSASKSLSTETRPAKNTKNEHNEHNKNGNELEKVLDQRPRTEFAAVIRRAIGRRGGSGDGQRRRRIGRCQRGKSRAAPPAHNSAHFNLR